MFLADDIDAAVRRLERAGGLRLAAAGHGVTPELIRASQRRARELRAAALKSALCALVALPRRLLAALGLRRGFDVETTKYRSGVSTLG